MRMAVNQWWEASQQRDLQFDNFLSRTSLSRCLCRQMTAGSTAAFLCLLFALNTFCDRGLLSTRFGYSVCCLIWPVAIKHGFSTLVGAHVCFACCLPTETRSFYR